MTIYGPRGQVILDPTPRDIARLMRSLRYPEPGSLSLEDFSFTGHKRKEIYKSEVLVTLGYDGQVKIRCSDEDTKSRVVVRHVSGWPLLGLQAAIQLITYYSEQDPRWMASYKWDPPFEPPPPARQPIQKPAAPAGATVPSPSKVGAVYLLRSGTWYKIGKAHDSDSRQKQLKIQLPEKAELVHQITTNNIDLLEKHWHRRFASQRANGEWFALAPDDIKEFVSFKSVELA